MRALAIAAVLIFATTTAYAQQQCGRYAQLAEGLSDKYGERRIAGGVQQGGQRVVEVWATEDGATFTILIRDVRGIACLLSAGEAWRAIDGLKGERS